MGASSETDRGRSAQQRVIRALRDVGLDPETRFRYPHEFSGGQRQRIALARAIVLEPTFVVLDEPTSALDMLIQAQMVDLLRDLQKRLNLTYLFISHDLRVVAALASRLMVMRHGKVVEEGPGRRAVRQSEERLYARAVRGRLQSGNRARGRGRAIGLSRSDRPACACGTGRTDVRDPARHHRLGPEGLGSALPHARAAARHPAVAGARRRSGRRRLCLRLEAAARPARRVSAT